MKKAMLFIVLMAIGLLAACGYESYGEYKYTDFEQLGDWEEVETLGEDGFELLYLYDRDSFGTSCSGCNIVNEPLFEFAKENEQGVEMKVANTKEIQGMKPLEIQTRAPRLYVYYEGRITDDYYGALPIKEFLDSVESGEYDWPEERQTEE
ncbi:MAG: hypothetical protein ACQEQA_05470 [Bacillota bacterium]